MDSAAPVVHMQPLCPEGSNVTVLRSEVIQQLLDLYERPNYLEVGVDHGVTFLPLRAARKVAVDPKFWFDTTQAPPEGTVVEHHEITSDAFFGTVSRSDPLFDVIFLDGLHTFEQTLRDLMSAALLLKPNGTIIVDDVIPNSYHSSLASTDDLVRVREFQARFDPKLQEDQAWMGDVYKIPFYVRSYMQQFSYATTSDNHGQTVMWRQPRRAGSFIERSIEAIGRLEYRDFIRHQDEMNMMPSAQIVAAVRSAIG